MQPQPSQSGKDKSCHFPADLPPLTIGPERDIITHVLNSVLWYLLNLHSLMNAFFISAFIKIHLCYSQNVLIGRQWLLLQESSR